MVRKGLVRAIGVSNFKTKQLQSLLKTATIPPAVNQIEAREEARGQAAEGGSKGARVRVGVCACVCGQAGRGGRRLADNAAS